VFLLLDPTSALTHPLYADLSLPLKSDHPTISKQHLPPFSPRVHDTQDAPELFLGLDHYGYVVSEQQGCDSLGQPGGIDPLGLQSHGQSMKISNNTGEMRHPCLTSLKSGNPSVISKPTMTLVVDPRYSALMNLRDLPRTPIVLSL
jgi:hypothetical protein